MSEAAGTELPAGACTSPCAIPAVAAGPGRRGGPGSPVEVTEGVRPFLQEIDEQT